MSTRTMETLKEKLCKELDTFAKTGDISRSDLEDIHKLTDTIKNLEKIMKLDEQGYSYDGDWNASGTYSRDGGMMEGRSYADGRMMDGRSMDGRSYARGRHYVRGHYSYGDDMMDRIEEMMNESNVSADEKSTLRRAMEILRR